MPMRLSRCSGRNNLTGWLPIGETRQTTARLRPGRFCFLQPKGSTVKVYLHSDNAEKSASYTVTVAPAADTDFVKADHVLAEWKLADGAARQIEVNFVFGVAEVPDMLGRYMVARDIAKSSRMLRKIFQLFNARGEPIEEVFDRNGAPVLLDVPQAA